MNIKLTVLLLSVCLVLGGCGDNSISAKAIFSKAQAYEKVEKYDQAIESYIKTIHMDPRYVGKFFKRGIRHKNLVHVNSLVRDYVEIYSSEDHRVTGYDEEGREIYYDDPREALKALNQLISGNNRSAKLYFNRGKAYYLTGQFDSALEDFNWVLKSVPNYARAYYQKALVNYAMSDVAKAIENCSQAIELNPYYARAYYARGIAWTFKGKHQKAIEDFTRAVDSHKDFASAYFRRGMTRYDLIYREKEDNINSVIEDYTKAISLNPLNAKYFLARGAVLMRYAKDYKQAADDFTAAIDLRPRYGTAYYNRAEAYYHIDEFDKSHKDLELAERYGFSGGKKLRQDLEQKRR